LNPAETSGENLARLETESRNPRTRELDRLPTAALVEALHAENYAVAEAVQAVLPQVAQVVDLLAERLGRGGRLFYVGAGTSGRLGVLDASECPPTFGVAPELVQGIIAGGETALTSSIEGAEDSPETGARDLEARGVTANDVVVGIAASGRTPYVIGALDAARQVGAVTVAVVNVSDSALSRHADITLAAVTGPEALTGSTRLKAGTAQKMILNLLTTAAMVRLGKVYDNLMVDLRATNSKLRDRAARIVMAAAETDRAAAEAALEQADWHAKTAIVMLRLGVSAAEASQRLQAANGWVRAAIEEDKPSPP
jgi:N-acetylmuramic acid 6-phosphate etherase